MLALLSVGRRSPWCDGIGSAARFDSPISVAIDNDGKSYVIDPVGLFQSEV